MAAKTIINASNPLLDINFSNFAFMANTWLHLSHCGYGYIKRTAANNVKNKWVESQVKVIMVAGAGLEPATSWL